MRRSTQSLSVSTTERLQHTCSNSTAYGPWPFYDSVTPLHTRPILSLLLLLAWLGLAWLVGFWAWGLRLLLNGSAYMHTSTGIV
jgi:hypothetical protein